VVHEVIEAFASEQDIKAAPDNGGCGDKGSGLVVGPLDADARPVVPLEHILTDVHEMTGSGTVFPNEEGLPILHVHAAFGREGKATMGCIRRGVVVWQVLEVIMIELLGSSTIRRKDPSTGFELLDP
jgi:predicted DNA-binding protein with PD1-like motif